MKDCFTSETKKQDRLTPFRLCYGSMSLFIFQTPHLFSICFFFLVPFESIIYDVIIDGRWCIRPTVVYLQSTGNVCKTSTILVPDERKPFQSRDNRTCFSFENRDLHEGNGHTWLISKGGLGLLSSLYAAINNLELLCHLCVFLILLMKSYYEFSFLKTVKQLMGVFNVHFIVQDPFVK
jgi:hypothetical protein